MTYSIVARCNKTGDLGVAIQSHWFNVGRETIWGHPGVGVIVTQSFIEPRYGETGLKYLQSASAQATLQRLLKEDNAAETRQVAVLGKTGLPAFHTGLSCIPYSGHSFDKNTSCQANLMQNEGVPEAMLKAYQDSDGILADKMLAALYSAQAMGGDLRGQQSAAMLIVSGKAMNHERRV